MQYIERNQFAQEVGVHPRTVARWVRQHKLPARKVGNRWYIVLDVKTQALREAMRQVRSSKASQNA